MAPLCAEAMALLGGVLLWFAAQASFRAFHVQWGKHRRRRARGDPLGRLAAADKTPKGIFRRPRSVTFAPELASVVEITDAEWEDEEPLPARAEEGGTEIGATLCDATGRNSVNVSAALSRDEDGDKCFTLLRGGDVVLDLKIRLLEFVRDDDAHVLWFTASQRQTSREHPIWTLWLHDPRAYTRLLAGLEDVPDCCVAVDECSVKSASRCRRMAARANGFVY